jgi:hypothetical protein
MNFVFFSLLLDNNIFQLWFMACAFVIKKKLANLITFVSISTHLIFLFNIFRSFQYFLWFQITIQILTDTFYFLNITLMN